MPFPRQPARATAAPFRARRWWGASVALALVLSGCAAPQDGEDDAQGAATSPAPASATAGEGSGTVSPSGSPGADATEATSSASSPGSGDGSAAPTSTPAPDPAAPLAARSHEGVPMRTFSSDERPPQFVLFSFDGGRQDARWKTFLDAAEDSGAKFTVFQTGINLIEDANRANYTAPGNKPGYVGTELGGDEAEVAQRIGNINTAHAAGHEIGTHYNGHLCSPTPHGGDQWTTAEWEQEYGVFLDIITDPVAYNPGSTLPDLAISPEDIKGGRLPCLDGRWDQLVPMWQDHGLVYDTSRAANATGVAWPYQEDGIWQFEMPIVWSPVLAEQKAASPLVMAMDYNFWITGNGGEDDPADTARLTDFQHRTYRYMFDSAYAGNRAPLVFGNHFNDWGLNAFNPAVERTMREVCDEPDAYCVTYQQMIDWLELQDPEVLAAWRGQSRSATGEDASALGW